jgi:hypothetical protein
MKLKLKEANLFKETHNKWLKESNFLARLFAKVVVNAIENDVGVLRAVSDADKALSKTRARIENRLDGDKEAVKNAIPLDVRKYLGFDY